MARPYRVSPALLVGSGSTPWDAVRLKQLARYDLAEANAADNLLDSVGARHLTVSGPLASLAGVARVFAGGAAIPYTGDSGARGTGSDAALGQVGTAAYAVEAWFLTGNVADGATRQVVSLREPGSQTGDLTFIVRREANALKLYIGDGNGNFSAQTIKAGLASNTLYHVVFRHDQTNLLVDYAVDGGPVTAYTQAVRRTTAANTPANNFAIGGDVREVWDGAIYRVTVFGSLLTDDEMGLVYTDPLGKV